MNQIDNLQLQEVSGGVLPVIAAYTAITLGGVATGLMVGYLVDHALFK